MAKKGRCETNRRFFKKTGSFYYHRDQHASYYVNVMLEQIFANRFEVN